MPNSNENNEDASWTQSIIAEDYLKGVDHSLRFLGRSAALRRYLPGESFEYQAYIYNAKSKEGLAPDLESQIIVFQNGNELLKSEPEAVNLKGLSEFERIPIMKTLHLGSALKPGEYVLQLQVRDKKAKADQSVSTQFMDFEILSK